MSHLQVLTPGNLPSLEISPRPKRISWMPEAEPTKRKETSQSIQRKIAQCQWKCRHTNHHHATFCQFWEASLEFEEKLKHFSRLFQQLHPALAFQVSCRLHSSSLAEAADLPSVFLVFLMRDAWVWYVLIACFAFRFPHTSSRFTSWFMWP